MRCVVAADARKLLRHFHASLVQPDTRHEGARLSILDGRANLTRKSFDDAVGYRRRHARIGQFRRCGSIWHYYR